MQTQRTSNRSDRTHTAQPIANQSLTPPKRHLGGGVKMAHIEFGPDKIYSSNLTEKIM